MQRAAKEYLQSYFQNNYQYEIPFFQRAYVWKEEQWAPLCEHITAEVEAFKRNERSEHFVGTIITKQLPQASFAVTPLQLVDGQQRLTTTAILLKALADTWAGELPNLRTSLLNFLRFHDTQGVAHFRIKHSRADAPFFDKVMLAERPQDIDVEENRIIEAYRFFVGEFKSLSDADRELYANVVLQRLPLIAMFLGENDDEQEIFDTINSLGVRLSVAELLKNYIFRDDALKPEYVELWSSEFEDDDDDLKFWNREKTAGRVKRTNQELLLYTVLIIETGKEVRMDKLFVEYKGYLRGMDTAAKRAFLQRLKAHAETYRRFPGDEDLNEIAYGEVEKRVFHVIEYLEITTVYPLLLFLYNRITDVPDRLKALTLIESYLVRRLVSKLTNKNYNRLFIQIVQELKGVETVNAIALGSVLLSYTDDSSRFPGDNEFEKGFRSAYLYNKYAQEVLFIIALSHLNTRLTDRHRLSTESYSVEHMMPKEWRAHWKVPGMTEEQKADRDWTLKTMGNLTLVTGSMNSTLKNRAWPKKRKTLREHSSLKITSDYLDLENWDENTIAERANDLATKAMEVWPMPGRS